jgi:hypothetical protein
MACLLGAWAAWACHRAQRRGLPGADALVWAGLAEVFLLLSQVKLARGLGWLDGLDDWLRALAKQNGLYDSRRQFQIVASVAVALIAVALFVYGLIWMWHHIKRYRLAIGFAALAVGFGIIRFISLHEVDAWNAALPWARTVVELIAAAGASAVAIARLRQLREFALPFSLTAAPNAHVLAFAASVAQPAPSVRHHRFPSRLRHQGRAPFPRPERDLSSIRRKMHASQGGASD